MSIRDILVHVDGPQSENAAALAAHLATQHGARLSGLHIVRTPQVPAYIEAHLGAEVMDVQARYAAEAAEKAKAVFEAAAQETGDKADWMSAQGEPLELLQQRGRSVDLVVVGQTQPDEQGLIADEDIAGRLALSLGRPVLAVPFAGDFQTVGKRVLVAWDGGRAAARALGDMIHLVDAPEAVTVLSVNGEEHDLDDVVAHLSNHGIEADAQLIESHDMDVGEMMLSRAADFGADLIVMGAYGHARWRELVMGGATQHMLQHMTAPVLMAH